MKRYKATLNITTRGKGLYDITSQVKELITGWNVEDGLCHLFIPHTSASLVLSENYDDTVREDLAVFLEKLVPESQSWMRHRFEGPNDSSSHLRSALLPTNLTIPVEGGTLALGTWQGIYLFEHRSHSRVRSVLIRMLEINDI